MPGWLDRVLELFNDEDDPSESFYDPVHLGAAVLLTIVAVGLLFWLLWTLFVYGGGLFIKIGPALRVLLTHKTLKDYGWQGSFDQGVFEGWFGNLCAFALCIVVIAALHRLYIERSRQTQV